MATAAQFVSILLLSLQFALSFDITRQFANAEYVVKGTIAFKSNEADATRYILSNLNYCKKPTNSPTQETMVIDIPNSCSLDLGVIGQNLNKFLAIPKRNETRHDPQTNPIALPKVLRNGKGGVVISQHKRSGSLPAQQNAAPACKFTLYFDHEIQDLCPSESKKNFDSEGVDKIKCSAYCNYLCSPSKQARCFTTCYDTCIDMKTYEARLTNSAPLKRY